MQEPDKLRTMISDAQEVLKKALHEAKSSMGHVQPKYDNTREERRKAAKDQLRFEKKRNKKLAKLTTQELSTISKIKELSRTCTTHGQLFFLNMCDSVMLELGEKERADIVELVPTLEQRGMELANTEAYKDIFTNYNNKLSSVRYDKNNKGNT